MPSLRPWGSIKIPDSLKSIPKMLTNEEAQYLIWVTAERYTGFGAVVDLGPWLGGSSAALAEGLKRRGAKTKVHCFDLFEWNPGYMERSSPRGLRYGDDFMPVFLEETHAYSEWITATRMNLLAGSWNGGPIEILFVDAAKSWELWSAILRDFGPFLVPGKTRVIQQDFRHPWCAWLPLTCDARPDVWKQVEDASQGDTVTFIPKVDLATAGLTSTNYDERSFDLEQSKRILGQRIQTAESIWHKQKFRLALMGKAIVEGAHDFAVALDRELRQQNPSVTPVHAQSRIAEDIDRIRDYALNQLVIGAMSALHSGDNGELAKWLEKLAGWPQQHLVRGIAAVRKGDDAAASAHLASALKADPALCPALLERAGIALRQGRPGDARDDVFAALDSRPNHPFAVQKRAFDLLEVALLNLKSATVAEDAIAHMQDRWSNNPDWFVFRGVVDLHLGRRERGRDGLDAALRLSPGHERARRLMQEWFTA